MWTETPPGGGSSCGKSWYWLGVAMGTGLAGTVLDSKWPVLVGTSYWGQMGGLCQGTNELVGEDLGMIIRLAPVPVMG